MPVQRGFFKLGSKGGRVSVVDNRPAVLEWMKGSRR